MKQTWALLTALLLLCGSGCYSNAAALEGHDFIDVSLGHLRTGIDEEETENGKEMAAVRARLSALLVKSILQSVRLKEEPAKLAARITKYDGLLNTHLTDIANKAERRRRERNTLTAIEHINAGLRDLTTVRLKWKDSAIEYSDKLRQKLKETEQ